MASSRKLSSVDLTEGVAARIAPLLPAHSSILVGLSGGVDSVVLLHLLHVLAPRYSWKISALHVHHGISPNADSWAVFCAELCQHLHIPLSIEHVDITPLRSQGIEAAARKLRHQAFASQACDFVALAHHADDQVETLLLQLLRGAGVRGASAMSVLSSAKLAGAAGTVNFLRPLLRSTRQEIVEYAADQGLRWVEDESNADDQYPRNFLRHRILPVLEERFPAYRDTLARSAQHFAEASGLLDELARQDAALALEEGELAVISLQRSSQSRARNLLRYFLQSHGATMPQTVQLDEMLRQLCDAKDDASVCLEYGEWQVRRYQGNVHVLRVLGDFDRDMELIWQSETELNWHALNETLFFSHVNGAGISQKKLQKAPLTLRLRRGGESLRPYKNAATRTLKNLLQEHNVPPWRRDRLPLLYCGEDLVCVPGVAIAAEYLADGHEAAVRIELRATRIDDS